MAWTGYFSFDGTEIINVQRTEAYAMAAGLGWFKPVYKNDVLGYMLGDGLVYKTPAIDDAPWVDPDNPDSLDFFGFYPLDIDGIENSTREATVYESTKDGGSAGRPRHATKPVVFNGILVAASECGAEYGMQWLKQALIGSPCSSDSGGCTGADLCYLSCEPDMVLPNPMDGYSLLTYDGGTPGGSGPFVLDGGTPYASSGDVADGGSPGSAPVLVAPSVAPTVLDPEECLTDYVRTLRKVTVTRSPQVTTKKEMTDGGAVWAVTFTATAGTPWEFGALVPIIEGFMDPTVTDPFVPGVSGGTFDLVGNIYTEVECATEVWDPLYDPLCPAMIPPPAPPDIPLGCYVPPANWKRRRITIPSAYVPLWGAVVPKIEVHARDADLRNLRLRFYADPFGDADVDADGCAYCGDIVISYVPQDTTLVFDGMSETIYVIDPGGRERRADSLVFRTDGKPFDWPQLTCGFGYTVTFDLPQTQAEPVVDLSLVSRSV